MRCKAKTKSGKPCKNSPQEGSEYCHIEGHRDQAPDNKELTTKQKRFVEEYTVDFNATQAAIRAGYSEKTAGEIGYENLKKPQISESIQERLEAYSMTANEALKRMTDWGRGDVRPFLSVDESTQELRIDLSSDQAQQHLHLIKEIKQNDTIVKKASDDDPDEVIGRSWEIKLHDAKDAVDKIIKVHGMYVENVNMKVQREEFDPENGNPEEYIKNRLQNK